jgi:hypothetical protein
MRGKTRDALVGYGLNTDLIEKIASHNYTAESLRSATKPKLAETFTEDEIDIVKGELLAVHASRGCSLARVNGK